MTKGISPLCHLIFISQWNRKSVSEHLEKVKYTWEKKLKTVFKKKKNILLSHTSVWVEININTFFNHVFNKGANNYGAWLYIQNHTLINNIVHYFIQTRLWKHNLRFGAMPRVPCGFSQNALCCMMMIGHVMILCIFTVRLEEVRNSNMSMCYRVLLLTQQHCTCVRPASHVH